MKDYNVHIFAEKPSIIFVNGKNVGVVDNVKTLCIDLRVYSKSIIVTCEPILSKNNLCVPYSVKLELLDNKIFCASDLVHVVPFPNNNYYLIFQPSPISSYKEIEKVYDEKIGKFNVIAVNDNQSYLTVYENNIIKFSTTTEELEKVNSYIKNNYLLVKGYTKTQTFYLLVLNTSDMLPLYNSICNKIEEVEDKIKTLSFVNDIAKHGLVYELNLNDNTTSQSYLVYANDEAITISENKLVPYALLEAIKLGNITLARKYLSEQLSSKASNPHLQNFFGIIKDIHYNCDNSNSNLVNYTIYNGNYHNYNFSVLNGKVDEIEEVNL